MPGGALRLCVDSGNLFSDAVASELLDGQNADLEPATIVLRARPRQGTAGPPNVIVSNRSSRIERSARIAYHCTQPAQLKRVDLYDVVHALRRRGREAVVGLDRKNRASSHASKYAVLASNTSMFSFAL